MNNAESGHGPSRQHPLATATGPVFAFPFPFWRDERGGSGVGNAGAAGLGPRENAAREPQDCFQPVGAASVLKFKHVFVAGPPSVLLSLLHMMPISCFMQQILAPTGPTKKRPFKSSRFYDRHSGCCLCFERQRSERPSFWLLPKPEEAHARSVSLAKFLTFVSFSLQENFGIFGAPNPRCSRAYRKPPHCSSVCSFCSFLPAYVNRLDGAPSSFLCMYVVGLSKATQH